MHVTDDPVPVMWSRVRYVALGTLAAAAMVTSIAAAVPNARSVPPPVGRIANDLAGEGAQVIVSVSEGASSTWRRQVAAAPRIASLYVEAVDYPTGQFSALSPDGRTLATGGLSSLVNVWDVRTGRLVREIEHNVGAAIWALEFSPDGKLLAISGGDGFASLWDVASGAQIGPRFGMGGREALIDLSSDGRRLLMTNGDGTGAVWDIDPSRGRDAPAL